MALEPGLAGLQQDIGFGRIDAIDEPDAAERLIERDKIPILELSDKVPFAIGAVQRPHLGEPAQLISHPVGQLAEDLDHDDGTNAGSARLVTGSDCEGGNGAVGNQPLHASGYRCARRTGHRSKGRYGRSGIVPKRAEEFLVKVIHSDHFVEKHLAKCIIELIF